MTATIVLASSVLVLVLTLALIREHRLRRGLQKLLSKLRHSWRNQNAAPKPTHRDDPPAGRL